MTFDPNSPPKIITFDCYGTLVQWFEVLRATIGHVLATANRSDLDPETVIQRFTTHARGLEQTKPHRLYRTVLTDSFTQAFTELDVPVGAGGIDTLVQSLTQMDPHPETQAVLTQLRSRYKLAIFTNSDEDLIAHAVRRISVPIDYVITAERAQAYKPSRAIFEYGHRVMGVGKDEIMHVAMSMDLDMQACHTLGMRGIWINRMGLAGNPDWLPYEELPDLRGVPALLGC